MAQVNQVPHSNCHLTIPQLKKPGYFVNTDCFYCAGYGKQCLVAAHPQAPPPAPTNPTGN